MGTIAADTRNSIPTECWTSANVDDTQLGFWNLKMVEDPGRTLLMAKPEP
jgi:hypothetical protein